MSQTVPSAASEASTSTVSELPDADAPATGAPRIEHEVVTLVNVVRGNAGCAPLVHDEGLSTVAAAHSTDMRDRNFFGPTNPDGLDPFDRAVALGQDDVRAENIARGQRDPAAVMDEWMSSSVHRANIVDCGARTLGMGIAEGPGGPWWTQLFGD